VDSNGYSKVSLEKSDEFHIDVYPRNSEGKDGCWRWGRDKVRSQDLGSDHAVVVAKQRRDGEWNIYEKSRKGTTKPKSIWDETEVISEQGTIQLGALGLAETFDHPKPIGLITKILRIASDDDDIVFDFFSGSSTTADAVLRLNVESQENRRFVLVQLPEPIDEESTKTAGFNAISDIGRERIKKAIEFLQGQADLATQVPDDIGFKSFGLTPSNFKQWRGDGIESAEELAEQMKMFVKSEKDGADTEDILYELLLKFGQELTTPVETLDIEGEPVFAIRDKEMLFVLAGFNEAMIDAIVALKPQEVVALDSVFQDSDELKTNFDLQCRDAGIRLTCI
jgi:adenine-specific DNA-methyltransferase